MSLLPRKLVLAGLGVSRRFHAGTISMAFLKPKGWKYKKVKPTKMDEKLLKVDKPVSGSMIFEEDMIGMNSKPFEFDVAALNERGYLRTQKAYEAPPSAIEQLLSVARSMNPKLEAATENDLIEFELTDSAFKFEFLCRAGKEFNHWVPNSLLYHIVTIRDAAKFYNTSVNTNTPYEDLMKRPNLPENLHFQKDALRFDPETDTRFGGVSAFPQSSTIVTGLRPKKKFKTIHFPRSSVEYK